MLGGSGGTVTVADRIQNVQLTFPSTLLLTTSTAGPETLTVQNIGTSAVNFFALPGGNPSLSPSSFAFNSGVTTCPVSTSATSLASGALCTLGVDYTPQTLTSTSGDLRFRNNVLNVSDSGQNVQLSGTVFTSPTQVVLSTLPSQLMAGGNLGMPTASVEDAHGNVATSSTATVTATITGPNGFSQTVTGTAVNGTAGLNLSSVALNTAGTYTVTASSNGLTSAVSTVMVTPGAAAQLSASPTPASITSGSNLGTVTATVQDANGNTVSSSTAAVTATITGPNGYSHTVTGTAVNGVASLNLSSLNLTAAGSYTVTTSSNGLTGAVSNVTVTAGAATQLTTSSAPSMVVSGGNLGTLTTTVQDANGNTVTGSTATVTETITGPNGYSHVVTGTAVNGVANINLSALNLTTAGSYTVITSSNGLTGTTSSVTVTAGAASQLATSALPASVISGGNLGTLTATVQDANSNTVANSTAAVTSTITGPNGYSHTVTGTAVNGVASLNLSSLNLTAAGSYTVTTSSNGLTGTTSSVTVTPGTASQLNTSSITPSVGSGGSLGTITATVKDANGNTVTGSTATVTATITGPNGYSQIVTGTAVNGVASLNLSSLNLTAAGTYTVTTSSNGLTASTSTVTVTAGAASQLTTSAIPASLTSGGNLGTATAAVKDANGNIVTGSTAAVTATITGPNGYSQMVTGTAVNGVASLNLSSLNLTAAGTYIVTTSSNGLTASTSAVSVSAGPAAQVSVSALPGNVTSGQSLGTVTATIKDANGNVVTNSSAQITATLTGPNGFSETVTGTAVNGIISLNLSSLNPTAAGSYTLSVSGAGLAPATSTFTVSFLAQTITLPNLPNVTYGVGATALPAATSAGLPITYKVTGPAVVNGTSLIVTGAGTVTVTATQAGDASHSAVTVTKSFAVAQAASSVALSSSSKVLASGASVTLTAQVASTAGTPTGTVTFMNGATVLGTAALSTTGSATLTLSTLPTGALNLTASYSGDPNHTASLSSLDAVAVQDFEISAAAGSSSVPVVPGAATNFALALTPGSTGFSSAITLTVTGLPAGAMYSFSPATVTPGTGTANTTLNVQTAKPVATARLVDGAAGITLALLVLPFGVSRKRRAALRNTRVLSVAAVLLLLGGVAGLTGCGSSNGFFGQPQKSYTLTVTATSGTLVRTTTVVLNVQ